MKVKKLKELLEHVDPELEIVLSSDGEGNEYSLLYGIEKCFFVNEGYERGYIVDAEDYFDDAIPAIVLYPN